MPWSHGLVTGTGARCARTETRALLLRVVVVICAACAVCAVRAPPIAPPAWVRRVARSVVASVTGGVHRSASRVEVDAPVGYDLYPSRCETPAVLGIVTCTKQPAGFRAWLSHHWETGFRYFYIRCEDTDDGPIERDVEAGPWKEGVRIRRASGQTSYFSLMQRQAAHVNESVHAAASDGVTHLLHIDDDELLWCPNGTGALESHLQSCLSDGGGDVCFHLQNIEASYEASSCDNPFTAATHFVLTPSDFTSYTNGKSIGAVSGSLRAHGPHFFTGRVVHVPAYVGVVVHYESACFEKWREKFAGYVASGELMACKPPAAAGDAPSPSSGATERAPPPSRTRTIPFRFYCDSMRSVARDATSRTTWEAWKRHRKGRRPLSVYKGRVR